MKRAINFDVGHGRQSSPDGLEPVTGDVDAARQCVGEWSGEPQATGVERATVPAFFVTKHSGLESA